MKYFNEGLEFNKYTDKNILQYCIGGLLYTPASVNLVDRFNKNKDIKSWAVCLEDACAGEEKECFENIYQLLISMSNKEEVPLIFIRVKYPKQQLKLSKYLNSRDKSDGDCKFPLKYLTGFIFPKFDSDNAIDYLENYHKVKELNNFCKLYFMPIIESKRAIFVQERVENLLRIRDILEPEKENILNIRVGAADFSNIYHIRREMKVPVWSIRVVADALTNIINVFGRDYIISGGVFEYFDGDNWEQYYRTEIQLDKENSFVGKTCIHPKQIPIILNKLKVSKQNFEDAKMILEADVNKSAVVKGTSKSMLEIRVHKNWAEKIKILSEIYGVEEND